ncbi:hypothetical protein HMPREF1549_02655 [Actinomyces johnsonii F0510]|uniref:Uncharacterized protein n=1 Tax=Actinomyces johnsonii F0510 TaxID=1227262 RepID=U1RC65_9ACTO|nr:hypothetical protein HMPREF1549_02655 [Actinomyces johnsonii F0510]
MSPRRLLAGPRSGGRQDEGPWYSGRRDRAFLTPSGGRGSRPKNSPGGGGASHRCFLPWKT